MLTAQKKANMVFAEDSNSNRSSCHLADDYKEISGHLYTRILDIFKVHYAVNCVDTATKLTFDSFKDVEKTIWIFKNYTLEDIDNIINHADS